MERAISFIRQSFFAARAWSDLDDLNAQARAWCDGLAADRPCPEDTSRSVRDAFTEERSRLLPLPDVPFPTDERVEVRVAKTPYVRFDGNDYSVPATHVRRTLTVSATPETVRVLDGTTVLAEHPRSYDRAAQIEDPAHLEALVADKQRARAQRGLDRLHHALPRCQELFDLLARRGANLGSATAALLRLLDSYGTAELETALDEALEHQAPSPHTLRLILERRRDERGTPPALPLELPDDPRVRDLVVRPHDLEGYDQLRQPAEDEHPEPDLEEPDTQQEGNDDDQP